MIEFLTTSGRTAVGVRMENSRAWRRPTLGAVAARAGVSTATVSNARNGTGRLSEASRQRVPAAARELGYAPASTARALARGGTGVLGLTMTTYGDLPVPYTEIPYYAQLTPGAMAAARARLSAAGDAEFEVTVDVAQHSDGRRHPRRAARRRPGAFHSAGARHTDDQRRPAAHSAPVRRMGGHRQRSGPAPAAGPAVPPGARRDGGTAHRDPGRAAQVPAPQSARICQSWLDPPVEGHWMTVAPSAVEASLTSAHEPLRTLTSWW